MSYNFKLNFNLKSSINLTLLNRNFSVSSIRHTGRPQLPEKVRREKALNLRKEEADAKESELNSDRELLRNDTDTLVEDLKPQLSRETRENVEEITSKYDNLERAASAHTRYEASDDPDTEKENEAKFTSLVCQSDLAYSNREIKVAEELLKDPSLSQDEINELHDVIRDATEHKNRTEVLMRERQRMQREESALNEEKAGSSSILDDFADPSTEPGDWTGGDD
jgi:hypothetical protein